MVIGNKRYSHVNIAQKHETIWQNIGGGGHFRYVVPNQIFSGACPHRPPPVSAPMNTLYNSQTSKHAISNNYLTVEINTVQTENLCMRSSQ